MNGKKMSVAAVVAMIVANVLASQASVSFDKALPVWPEGREVEMNGFYRFRADVVSPTVATGTLRATAAYAYRARVNGAFVGYGPARSVPGFFRVDEWPVSLVAGTNVVELEVAGYNCNNFYLPDQTPFVQTEVTVGGIVLAATSQNGGFAAHETGRVRKAPRFCYQRGFAEIYRLPASDSAALPLAEQPAKTLLPREWAYPAFTVTEPFAAVSTECVIRDENAKIETPRCLVQSTPGYKIFPLEELAENPHFDLQRLKTVSRVKGVEANDGWYRLDDCSGIVFETGREHAGFPRLSVRCRGPVTLYLTFDEFLQPDGSVDNFRAETLGALTWHLDAGEYELEGFEPVALKCARILAVGGSAEIRAPSVRTYVSSSVDRASFRASDPAFEKIFDAAKASYAANAVDCLTDCPIRERAGWLGDSFFTGRASQWLTGSGKNERLFLDNFLRPEAFVCDSEFEGLVPAVWPANLMTKDCFIPNYDMWFVLELDDYVRRTGDVSLAAAFRQRVLTFLKALDRRLNGDGLLENLPGWVFVEWSFANKLVQDVNYPSNMMYAETLSAAARLYALPELAERARKMRETIRAQSLTKDGWFCDNAVRQQDGTLKLSGHRTETCQYYAFFTGVATKERDAELWGRLVMDFGPERIKNAKWDCGDNLWQRLSTPIREGVWKEIWPANMIFGTCLRMELLSRDGRSAQIAKEMKEHFLPMAEKTGTLWEHGDPRASCCHGFASIAAEYLFRDVLGVRNIDAAAKTIRVEPSADLPLDWCEGNVPLPDGAVAVVSWRKEGGKPVVKLSLPAGWTESRLVLETKSLQNRIDELAASGGGTLVVERGTHLTGALFFRPGVNLHLEEGAVLLGSDDPADYPKRMTRIEGQTHPYYPALINADACDGFRVTGSGVIDGHGLPTWKKFWKLCAEQAKKGGDFSNQHPDLVRPRLFYVSNSKHVDVSGVTFKNAKFWTTHYYRCEDLFIHDCTIVSECIEGVNGPSTDAIDLDVVRHAVISNVVMDVNDDAVVLKGGKGPWADDPEKHPENGPNSDIEIVGCLFKSVCHQCLCFGSECVRGTNVRMHDCRVENPHCLLRLKMRPDTPQVYEDIVVSNICGEVRTVLLVVPWMQYFDLKGRPDRPKSYGRNVTLSDLDLTCDRFATTARSDDYELSDFTFERLNVRCKKDASFDWGLVKGVRKSDVSLRLVDAPF